MDSLDDATLIERAKGGDQQAYAELVQRHYRAAYASAYAVLGNSSDAEEIAQDTFAEVFRKLDRLREPKALLSWIWRIARDSALKHIRKHRRMRPAGDGLDAGASDERPDDGLLAGEEKEALLRALGRLPEEMREALLMKYWHDLDYETMAERTGVSEPALYQRVCRGLKRLREILADREAG